MSDFIFDENPPDSEGALFVPDTSEPPDSADPPNTPDSPDPAEPPSAQNPKPGHSTGPRSITGKARSSMNRLTHGCRSSKTVLPDEDPAEFEAAMQAWYDQYQPAEDDDIAAMLVEETGRAHWFFKRNRKRLEEVEHRMPCDAGLWTRDQDKRFSNALRYQTTAQREFFRWFKSLEQHFQHIHRDEQAKQLALSKMAAIELQWIERKEKQGVAKDLRLRQTVEVEVIDGKSRSSYYPTNQELLDLAARRSETPLYVARCIVFPDNIIPSEYAWTNACRDHNSAHPEFLEATQKMSWQRWLQLIEYEKSLGHGHALPTWSLLQHG